MSLINRKYHRQTLRPPVFYLWIFAFLLIMGCQIVLHQSAWAQNDRILFQEDFEDGMADGWVLSPGWSVVLDNGNRVLCYSGFPEFAMRGSAYPEVSGWVNHTIEFKLKIIKGNLHIVFRQNPTAQYWLGIPEGGGSYLAIARNYENIPPWYDQVVFSQGIWALSQWYSVKIILNGTHIQIYRDNILIIDYTDNTEHAILTPGGIGFEAFFTMIPGGLIRHYFDDIKVTLVD